MDRENLLELINKLYRMTLLFPKKEPLRYKMREIAGDILANFVVWEVLHSPNPGGFAAAEKREKRNLIFSIEKNLEILNSYFEVAKWQNWVSYFDILEMQEEYDKIKCKIKEEIERLNKTEIQKTLPTEELRVNKQIEATEIKATEKERSREFLDSRKEKILDYNPSSARQGKILEFLKEKGKAQVWEVNKILPEVSKRTLRRDFVQLLEKGVIERIGERNNTFYRLRGQALTP